MTFDKQSHEMGVMNGQLGLVLETLRQINSKMDAGDEKRELLFVELRNVKHDYRGLDMKIEMLATGVEKNNAVVSERMAAMEAWQNRMIGRVSAFGIAGAIAGWVLVHLIAPLIFGKGAQ